MQDAKAQELVAQIKTDLIGAMKERATIEVSALRALLARISNAEAVQAPYKAQTSSTYVAGASVGVGSTESSRKELSYADIQVIIHAELTEIQTAKQQLLDADPYAAELNQKLTILRSYQRTQ